MGGNLALLFEIRTSLYDLVAAGLYCEPSADSLKGFQEQLAALTELSPSWAEEALWACVRGMGESIPEANTEDLAVDYAGLFLSGRDGSACPTESSYLDNVIYGPSALDVMEFYVEAGFVKEDVFSEPEDHIALECAFMGLMGKDFLDMVRTGRLESAEARTSLERQRAFLADHLLKWVPHWAGQVESLAETPFYRALARLARTLIEADKRLLLDVPRPEKE
jgi:TorA maturation chaperone TorD